MFFYIESTAKDIMTLRVFGVSALSSLAMLAFRSSMTVVYMLAMT